MHQPACMQCTVLACDACSTAMGMLSVPGAGGMEVGWGDLGQAGKRNGMEHGTAAGNAPQRCPSQKLRAGPETGSKETAQPCSAAVCVFADSFTLPTPRLRVCMTPGPAQAVHVLRLRADGMDGQAVARGGREGTARQGAAPDARQTPGAGAPGTIDRHCTIGIMTA